MLNFTTTTLFPFQEVVGKANVKQKVGPEAPRQ